MVAHKGVRHHKAKLTEEDVRLIRRLRRQGASYFHITERLGWKVHPTTVEDAGNRKTWRHLK